MGKNFSHLTWDKRIEIASYLKIDMPIKKIAELVGVHISTIYREIKRGVYIHKNSTLDTVEKYSPDIAEEKYKKSLNNKGRHLKIGKDQVYANYLEEMVVDKKYSPQAVLMEIKNKAINFKTSICFKTFYNYIQNGVFIKLTNKDLPVKKNKKRGYNKIKRRTKIYGESIEKRPAYINERLEFGHWEMDCVVGKKTKGKTLLVLTERKTRYEIIILIPEQKVKYVIKALDDLEKKMGFKKFSSIFKSITVDNGSEFAGSDEFERSTISKKKKRTKLYYCHPYSSWERGSNENANKFIRRHLPKGTDFKDLEKQTVSYIEEWMNNYPRRIFDGKTANDMYIVELDQLNYVS